MVYISIAKANALFHVFHLSQQLLDDEIFKFTPRVPRAPYNRQGAITEDDFTPRVSLAPTIELAQKALGNKDSQYVYAGNLVSDPADHIPTIKISKIKLTLPHYGPYFSLIGWLTKIYGSKETDPKLKKQLNKCFNPDGNFSWSQDICFKPSTLPRPLKQQFKYAVPDAEKTKEEWSLKPIKLLYLGELDGDFIELSDACGMFLKNKGLLK